MLDAQDHQDAIQAQDEAAAQQRIALAATIVEVKPPVPSDAWDWCAFVDPEGAYGWGWTREAALEDLVRQLG